MSRKAPQTYAASISRLKVLVAQLESAEVDVDELETVVKESVELITVCRTRLRATQTSVDTLLAGLREEVPVAARPVTDLAADDEDETDPFLDD
jgi:exodeoxyribonuclease VII small subunit